MTPTIAIVGMACRYPDANSPQELWENVLAQRKAFRKLPAERLCLRDYFDADREAPDSIYSQSAALIRDYEFDRNRYRVVGSTYRSADLTHWLALDVAAEALADAGFPDGAGLPRASTGVILGNTLTGEMSRAQSLRLRWPYVRRVVSAQLHEQGMPAAERQAFLSDLEGRYKAPFEPVGSESLAGNLANTIAGRICNYFDLNGGGFVVDGACSSSLLAVTQACGQLLMGELDVAIVGGVDVSIDPFELVGFAKVGALSPDQMLVYDRHSAGFIPGEGCGMMVLMTHDEAIAQQRRIYAVIQGWGVSSDGQGGITRPEVHGQKLAIHSAYRRAQWSIETVGYFEGHGTGTVVGDATELQALSESRCDAGLHAEAVAIGSIKANIGHTKAAAGIAGLIKATLALHRQVLPPTSACPNPQERLSTPQAVLKVPSQGSLWPAQLPLRAGVSSMGFGGINTHIALENPTQLRRTSLSSSEQLLLSSHQDAELLVFSAASTDALLSHLTSLLPWVERLSRAELGDFAHTLAERLDMAEPVRAALVVESVANAVASLQQLLEHLRSSQESLHLPRLWFQVQRGTPRIGFLFPGQAAPVYRTPGLWGQRFPSLVDLHKLAELPDLDDSRSTQLAQPAIIASSLLGLEMLRQLRIDACVAVGHSLGELAALHWAGSLDRTTVLELARQRGLLMQTHGTASGTMASLEADAATVAALLSACCADPLRVRVAGINSPCQTVIAGSAPDIAEVVELARQQGLHATLLPVSQAFHSPLMAPVVQPLKEVLQSLCFSPLQQVVYSTVKGDVLPSECDIQTLLLDQITQPVQFLPALQAARSLVDLWIEVGPGHILSRLVSQSDAAPCVALDSGSSSLSGLLEAIAAVFTLGGSPDLAPVFARRFHRPLALGQPFHFFRNPCELVPDLSFDSPPPQSLSPALVNPVVETVSHIPETADGHSTSNPLETLRQLVARRTELPLTAIADHHRFLSDLHLNSITVGQLISEAAQQLAVKAPADPTTFANATLVDVATALSDLTTLGTQSQQVSIPLGASAWVRAFVWDWQPQPLRIPGSSRSAAAGRWDVVNLTGCPLPAMLAGDWTPPAGRGVLVILPVERSDAALSALLSACQSMLAADDVECFALVHSGWGPGFAKTFFLEYPHISTIVLDLRPDHPRLPEWLADERQCTSGFTEVRYTEAGDRFVPRLTPVSVPADCSAAMLPDPVSFDLSADDCLLVSGGGKGIAAECALAIALQTGCQVVLLGRSDPAHDAELAGNLARFMSQGIQPHYTICDVGDRRQVQQVIQDVSNSIGPVTAILHGAGINAPRLIPQLTPLDITHTLAPKVAGFVNLLECIDGAQLKQVITFGSIIARSGLPGEADYATANEALSQLLLDFQHRFPDCHCLNLEWSVWSGAGMGERLGRIDLLSQRGIQAITPDQGIKVLRQLMRQPLPCASLVVSSRFGSLPTLSQLQIDLPLLRFLERPRVYYPGIELVVDVELSVGTDPYLRDHLVQGEAIFPGVMGIEAMVQVAQSLVPNLAITGLSSVVFHRPIVVPSAERLAIQIAATVQDAEHIDVVIRSAQTGFAVDHFQAKVLYGSCPSPLALPTFEPLVPGMLDVERHLYGHLLFHQGRFQRVLSYPHLRAQSCIADVRVDARSPWFSDYLPQTLLCGDPGARDAAIHALQACVPHVTILPIGIQHVHLLGRQDLHAHRVTAIERSHSADQFVYDVWITSPDGELIEMWQGLALQVMNSSAPRSSWVAPLLPPYLERCFSDVHRHSPLAIALAHDPSLPSRQRIEPLLARLLQDGQAPTRRPDGKPDPVANQPVSVSHCDPLTLLITQPSSFPSSPASSCLDLLAVPQIACDLERVDAGQQRPWEDLLGDAGIRLANRISAEAGEPFDAAATRIWSARECLKKAGLPLHTNLTLQSVELPVVWLRAQSAMSLEASTPFAIATWVLHIHEIPEPLVIAILAESSSPASVSLSV